MTELQKDYGAENIKVLVGLEGVRMRPSMYIGNTAEEGLHHLIYEIVDNSIDEALAGHCNQIKVTFHQDGSVSVEDNGRGIPTGMHAEGVSALELVLCTLHAGGKFDHSTYKVSGGLHGVGVSVVNALSTWLVAEVKREGKIFRQSYERGVKTEEVKVLGEAKTTGTKITFLPDPEIFTETTEFKYEIIQNRLKEMAFLNKNIRILLKDENTGASDEFHYDGGIVSYVEYLNRNRTTVHLEPIMIAGEKDDVQVEVCFQYFDGYSERLFSFVNNINTKEGGTHVAGFRGALTKCINRYASDDVVNKNLKNIKLGGDDVREGLTCVISVRVPNPQFEGQTKTKLGNSEVKSIVESICNDKLAAYLEEHPLEAKKILSKAIDALRAREAARKAKELSRKKGLGIDILMAGKLAECQVKDPAKREIFIVEGDSAGGSAKQGRDRSIQAILPLRGKIMNVEKARFDKVLSSEEIKQIIAALGTGIGQDEFDIEKLRYHKIIIMTDADVDGAHIRTLLLTFFYREMVQLIENGHVYIGQPPLYRLGRGKKEQFFLNEDSLNRYLFDQAGSMMTVKVGSGAVVAQENLLNLMLKLSGYQKLIEYLARINIGLELNNYLLAEHVNSADQFEDEAFVQRLQNGIREKNMNVTPVRLCRWKPSCYEFEAAIKDKAHMVVTVGPQIPLIHEYRQGLHLYPAIKEYLHETFTIESANKTLQAENWQQLIETVKGETFKGSSLQRYKGLGEMNPDQLWETSMNPEKRTLLQVTINDVVQADDLFTTLMGDKVEPRREFIQNHALEVSSLDI